MTHGTNSQSRARSALHGQRAVVIGLGREGRDLARFLHASGATVTMSDSRPAEALQTEMGGLAELPGLRFSVGGHAESDLDTADVVYSSPGVPPEIPFLRAARQRGIPISSATELFFALSPAPILGITGSSGKSTTTAMTGSVLRADGRDVLVGGNIGVPVLGRLEKITAGSWVVMELSSFQLEFMQRSPAIATVTNITPNHLDRHVTMDAYREAKAQILAHQSADDWAILNRDDDESRKLHPRGRRLEFSQRRPVHGAFQRGDVLMLDLGNGAIEVCRRESVHLRGEHNIANALAVIATASAAGVGPEAVRAGIEAFRALPHRLEPVGTVHGATYYNDSIATAPERSIAAMHAFAEPIVLLAGGRDKYLPMAAWAELMRARCRHVVMFGEAAPLIEAAARSAGVPAVALTRVTSLDEAVAAAAAVAREGDAVLLSPGCTSYDAFFDFEARGERFRELVAQMGEES